MKILIVCSTLDLGKPFGATPSLWQLFKGFYEEGVELIVIPYHGHSINSIWWRSYQNPNYYKGMLLEKILRVNQTKKKISNSSLIPLIGRLVVKPTFYKLIHKILQLEKNINAILFIGIPVNQLSGLASIIRNSFEIPILLYDLDVPTSLPSQGGFTFNYLKGADLSEYDSIIVPSEGSVTELMSLGARQVHIVHFGVDPDVYKPMLLKKDMDFFFFGNDASARFDNLNIMIKVPSLRIKYNFFVSGRNLNVDLGATHILPHLSFNQYREYCCRAKVNLNVVRNLHAKVPGTSTSRPFELAAMQCCIVSAPYKGLEKWFDIKREILIANSSKECVEIYQNLMENEELRNKMGTAACNRIKMEHTSRHRARQIIEILKKIE